MSRPWWRRPESGWGILGLALMFVPILVALGFQRLGGPWPGDTGMAIIGYECCAMFVACPLGLTCAILGFRQQDRRQMAGLLAFAVPIASFLGIQAWWEGPVRNAAVAVTIGFAAFYLVSVIFLEGIRGLLSPEERDPPERP